MSYAGSPSDQQRFLRITEIMYNPTEGGDFDNEEYEYIELKNIGTAALSLEGVKFADGILFVFPNISLPGNGYVVIVKNQPARPNKFRKCKSHQNTAGFSPQAGQFGSRHLFSVNSVLL